MGVVERLTKEQVIQRLEGREVNIPGITWGLWMHVEGGVIEPIGKPLASYTQRALQLFLGNFARYPRYLRTVRRSSQMEATD